MSEATGGASVGQKKNGNWTAIDETSTCLHATLLFPPAPRGASIGGPRVFTWAIQLKAAARIGRVQKNDLAALKLSVFTLHARIFHAAGGGLGALIAVEFPSPGSPPSERRVRPRAAPFHSPLVEQGA